MRVLGLFDHNGVNRHQNRIPIGSPHRVAGPYGVDMLMDEGIDLLTVPPATGRVHGKLRNIVEHRTGVRADLALRGGLSAARADGVLALLEDKSVLPSLLKQHKIPPYYEKPLSVISCWWAEELVHSDEKVHDRIRKTLKGIDKIYCFSRNQVAIFENAGFPGQNVIPLTFGVDPNIYTPGPATKDLQVVSAGVDRGRDYHSLMKAAALLPDIQFDIFTQPERIHASDRLKNVRVHPPGSMYEHRENLRSAKLVVIPTHKLAYPTGQSVLLEAMACGACVAVTATPAMSEYIDDGVMNLAIPHADPEGIAKVIRRAMDSDAERQRIGEAARLATTTRFSFAQMWKKVASSLIEDGKSRLRGPVGGMN